MGFFSPFKHSQYSDMPTNAKAMGTNETSINGKQWEGSMEYLEQLSL